MDEERFYDPHVFNYSNTNRHFQYHSYVEDPSSKSFKNTIYNVLIVGAIFLVVGIFLYIRFRNKKEDDRKKRQLMSSGLFHRYVQNEINKHRIRRVMEKKKRVKRALKKTAHLLPYNNKFSGNYLFI